MEVEDSDEFRVENHVNSCRFCFRPLTNHQKSVEITEAIEQKFFELTQLQLIVDDAYSSFICIPCNGELQSFSLYRCNLIKNQKMLNNSKLKQAEDIFSNIYIKSEMNLDLGPEEEFNDCSAFVSTELIEGPEIIRTLPSKRLRNQSKPVFDNQDHQKLYEEIQLVASATKDKKIKCPRCSRPILRNAVKDHILTAHLKQEKFRCDICSYEFERLIYLNAHMTLRHSDDVLEERVHQCKNCGKNFKTSTDLMLHVESHGISDTTCAYCGKVFGSSTNLQTHLLYHSAPQFSCTECGKKFFIKKKLREHQKSHIGQSSYICQLCSKTFSSQNHLKRHTASVHNKLRFYCNIPGCATSFSRREIYKRHALCQHHDLGTESLQQLLQSVHEAQPTPSL